MESTTQAAPISTKRLWTGRVLTTLIVLFFIFDGVIHILKPPPVVEAFKELGLPLRLSVPIAIVELACLALYAIPQTCILGASFLPAIWEGQSRSRCSRGIRSSAKHCSRCILLR
jgi:DoxX-like family